MGVRKVMSALWQNVIRSPSYLP